MKKQEQKGKITTLYERFSHDDGRSDENVSVENQKRILEDYAQKMVLPTSATSPMTECAARPSSVLAWMLCWTRYGPGMCPPSLSKTRAG